MIMLIIMFMMLMLIFYYCSILLYSSHNIIHIVRLILTLLSFLHQLHCRCTAK